MISRKDSFSKLPKVKYKPKYHSSNIKAIMESLYGTGYHKREFAELLMQFRAKGFRWNKVEDAINEEHLRKSNRIIDDILNIPPKISQLEEFTEVENGDEYFDDYEWLYFQREMADIYNNRGLIDGLQSYCDFDDIDDGWRKE